MKEICGYRHKEFINHFIDSSGLVLYARHETACNPPASKMLKNACKMLPPTPSYQYVRHFMYKSVVAELISALILDDLPRSSSAGRRLLLRGYFGCHR